MATQIGPEGLFWVGMGGTMLEHQWRHPDRPVGAIWSPEYEKSQVHKLERRSVHIVGPEKTIDDSNGALLKQAYHLSHCGIRIRLQGRFSLTLPCSAGRFIPNLLVPVGQHLGHSMCGKWPKLVCLDVFIGVPTSFLPLQPKIGPLDQFVWPKGYHSLFWPFFGHHRATFGKFWVWQMAQTGLSGCHHECSNFVLPLPTLWNELCGQKAIFCLLWPLSGPSRAILGLANGPNWSTWMSYMPFH